MTFTRTGPASGAITVSYTISGSARSGIDFASNLTGTTTIPDGSASTTLPVTALPGATASSVTAAVAPSNNYSLGVSQAATVRIVAAVITPPGQIRTPLPAPPRRHRRTTACRTCTNTSSISTPRNP